MNQIRPRVGVACEFMALEGGPVKRTVSGFRRIQDDSYTIHASRSVAVVSTGIRKECARSAVNHLLKSYPTIKDLIHIGFTGSLDASRYSKGDVLIGSSVKDFDGEGQPEVSLSDSMDILRDSRLETERILSVNGFVTGKTDPERLAALRAAGTLVDMEAYATAQACLERKVTPHVVKMVSDVIIDGRSGFFQALGLPGNLFRLKNIDPAFQEMLKKIWIYRG